MVLDPRKRQKKLERKTAKRKAQLNSYARQYPTDVGARFRMAATAPIVHSLAGRALWNSGIGHVLLSREISPGQLAFSAFLVDMYCLGVKNAMWSIGSRGEVNALAKKLEHGNGTVKLKPACARHLVEGAVEYARDLGFAPHEDYQRAKLIFGDIDRALCAETFVYGLDGKPYFIAGPNDSPARCRQIVNTLNSRHGPNGHHFVISSSKDGLSQSALDLADGDGNEDE